MRPPIYQPTGPAGEYAEWALNISLSCPHRCYYCSAPRVLHKNKDDYFRYQGSRPGIISAVKQQLEKEKITGRLIHIPFIGDAYPNGFESSTTRKIIKLLKAYGNNVQILTKNGADAVRDFDLLDENDWFGVTYAGYSIEDKMASAPAAEPGAGGVLQRLEALRIAHSRGIKTWLSCEPVLNADDILDIIASTDYVDEFKIGKLNYFPSDINWMRFGQAVETACKRHGRRYYIKKSLRGAMNSHGRT